MDKVLGNWGLDKGVWGWPDWVVASGVSNSTIIIADAATINGYYYNFILPFIIIIIIIFVVLFVIIIIIIRY